MDNYYARDLREHIEILILSKSVDSGGGAAYNFISADPPILLRAAILADSASEPWQGEQLSSHERLRLAIRFWPGLNQTMKVKWGTRTFEITGMRRTGKLQRWLELDCEERLAG